MRAACPILYRTAVPADVPEFCGLVRRVFRESLASECTAAGCREFMRRITITAVARRMRGQRMLVAEAGRSIVGVAEIHRNYLVLLFVRDDHRGRGIARGLVREAFQLLPGTPPRHVYVGAARAAVRVYERMGFRAVREQTDECGIPCVLMRLEWNGERVF
ncbi:MAG: GNAT family N-acetyltransferase [Planctomycetota bacterium]